MENNIVQILILFVIVGINYGCQKLTRSNPEMISGFHWGKTDEEKENDRAWLILNFATPIECFYEKLS